MQKEFITALGVEETAAQAVLDEHLRIVDQYRQQLRAQAVDSAIKQAVSAQGGRNLTAIRALLDESSFGEDVEADAAAAVTAVRRENPYLFAAATVTAPGTGTATAPTYTPSDLGKLSYADYRRYRKGC